MKFITTATIFAALAIATASAGSSSKSRKSKSGSSNSSGHIANGFYFGTDTEDGSSQALGVLCDDGHCDITLSDVSFSTCFLATGAFFSGVGIARNVPEEDLADFDIDLYCLQTGETEIDYNDPPSATLKGDLVSLPNGAIRRTGTGFTYFKASDDSSGKKKKKKKMSSANGYYFGVDIEDGTTQFLDILCIDGHCDINLGDVSFSTCAEKYPMNFVFGGVAVARNVPEDELNDFKIELFCLDSAGGQLSIDIETATPDNMLTGNIVVLGNGIIRRTGPGFVYFKTNKE